jgi:hypothetical protein
MKKIRIIQAAIVVAFITVLAGCSSSYYPYSGTSASLIVSSPGIYATRYPDGRYYYRNPQGYMYWRGYDNRYYLDRSYIGKVHYGRGEYNEWRRYNGHSKYHYNR